MLYSNPMIPVNDNKIKEYLKYLMNLSYNKHCADCGNKNPSWATLTFSFFICYDCASLHRKLNIKKTVVKSTQIDTWDVLDLRRMYIGGNKNSSMLPVTNDFNTRYKHVSKFLDYLDKLQYESEKKDPKANFMNINKNQFECKKININTENIKIQKPKFSDNFEDDEIENDNEVSKKIIYNKVIPVTEEISEEDNFRDFRSKNNSKDNLKKTLNPSRSPFCFNPKEIEESESE